MERNPYPTLVITPGDPFGIGPEVTWKSLTRLKNKKFNAIIVGAKSAFKQTGFLKSPWPRIQFIEPPKTSPHFLPGFQSGWAIEKAVTLIQQGDADALVTGPISKERLQQGGYQFNGHTDFLAKLTGTKEVTMCLKNSKLCVTLVTTHLALAQVSASITPSRITRAVNQTEEFLRTKCGIRRPKIAVCGLNPHAGENGVLGSEELSVITPTLKTIKRTLGKKAEISGPHPADTLFIKPQFDAIVGMYHDQVLIPVKMIDFENTVNITLGLPFVRTSVDHGTAFDIAGKNIASPSSMIAAILEALKMIRGKS